MRYLAPCENFENILQFKRFGLYSDLYIVTLENCYFYIEMKISNTEILWGSGALFPKKIEMIDAIWCVLMYYFIRFSFEKMSVFIIKK